LFQNFGKSDERNGYPVTKECSPYSSGMWETQMFLKQLNWQCWINPTAWPVRRDEDSLCAFVGNRTMSISCAAYKLVAVTHCTSGNLCKYSTQQEVPQYGFCD
jgi:hypothetical protein